MNSVTPSETDTDTPRLDPIDNPSSLKLKFAYWLTKKDKGKVITPLKVVYARFPESLSLAKEMVEIDDKFTIDSELKHLIHAYTATLNGCGFCKDMAKANFKKENKSSEKIEELLKFEESDSFDEAEKAALSYVDEVTRNKQVSDNTFERLKKYFDENEIVQITLINAIENFYNSINAPLNIGSDEICKLWHNGQQ